MTSYILRQSQIIAEEARLRIYGALLGLTHILTFIYWNQGDFFKNSQSAFNVEPICYPLFPNCDLFRASLSSSSWQILLYAYLFFALFCTICFTKSHLAKLAYPLLIILTLFKMGLHFSNYNLSSQFHLIGYLISIAFLFLPNKFDIPKYLLLAFYISLGFSKLNFDWLSGSTLIGKPMLKGALLHFSLIYMVLLPLVFSFGLLHPNRWVRWALLLQISVMHILSWKIYGFIYPLMMLCFLGSFFIDEIFAFLEKATIPNRLLFLLSFKEKPLIYGILLLFAAFQIFPYLMAQNPKLSAATRLMAFSVMDSKLRCKSLLVANTEDGSFHIRPPIKNLGRRLKCDPIRHLNQAHRLCRKNIDHKEIKKLSLHLFSRSATERQYKKVVSIDDVCSHSNPLWSELSGGGP